MVSSPSKSEALREIGVAGSREAAFGYTREDFLPQLRGERGMRVYREMRDNDAVIGAILTSMDMMLRSVEWRVAPAADTPEAQREKEFVQSLISDMSHSWPEFITEVLTFLPFGFSAFETVYKRREGPDQRDPKRRSRHDDGRIGIRKLAPRAQWTLERWIIGEDGGVDGMVQRKPSGGNATIPIDKLLLFRTVTVNNAPSGRSVLRNAYKSWYYVNHLQQLEGIWAERDLTGVPKGKIPAEYLNAENGSDQAKVRDEFAKILRDLKFNEQGYLMVPSDTYTSEDGQPSTIPMMDIELMGSPGQRTIDTSGMIQRYQHDMARAVLADFVMLGSASRGSFALSRSKTNLFLRSLQGHLNTIAAVLNRHLLPRIWDLNGLDYDLMPELKPGDVAPVDIGDLGEYIRNLSFANINLSEDPAVEDHLRQAAGFPEREGATTRADDTPEGMGE
jgi:hypothetical protein